MEGHRSTWLESEITDVSGADFVVRTYIEQCDLRHYLSKVVERTDLRTACDVGAGYGRLTLVLAEFADRVVAVEREKELLDKAAFLQPTVEFRHMASLAAVPAADDEFDFALTFTVLQHVWDDEARKALREIVRIVRPGGFILLCEETDEMAENSDIDTSHSDFIGRRVERYREWLHPCYLTTTSARRIERGYERSNVGDYMLFRVPDPK